MHFKICLRLSTKSEYRYIPFNLILYEYRSLTIESGVS